jgi:retron-type reverse transcriptase
VAIGEETFKVRKGIPQGSLISPLLFDIFINELVIQLNRNLISDKNILCYADDIAIFFENEQVLRRSNDALQK